MSKKTDDGRPHGDKAVMLSSAYDCLGRALARCEDKGNMQASAGYIKQQVALAHKYLGVALGEIEPDELPAGVAGEAKK